jgi:hypothetical protein
MPGPCDSAKSPHPAAELRRRLEGLASLASSGREAKAGLHLGVLETITLVVPFAVSCALVRLWIVGEVPQLLFSAILGTAAILTSAGIVTRGDRESLRILLLLSLEILLVVATFLPLFLAYVAWS